MQKCIWMFPRLAGWPPHVAMKQNGTQSKSFKTRFRHNKVRQRDGMTILQSQSGIWPQGIYATIFCSCIFAVLSPDLGLPPNGKRHLENLLQASLVLPPQLDKKRFHHDHKTRHY